MRRPSIKVWAGSAAMVCAIGAVGALTMAPGAFAATTNNPPTTTATTTHAHHGHHGHHKPSELRGAFKNLAGYLKLKPGQLMKDLRHGQTLVQVAAAQGISQQSLLTEVQTLVNTRISQAVTKGHMTQTQATARQQKIDAKLATWITQTWSGRHKGSHALSLHSEMLKEAATLLQLSPKALMTDLKSGESIDQIATAKGLSTQQLTQQLDSAIAARINSTVPTFLQHTWHKAKAK